MLSGVRESILFVYGLFIYLRESAHAHALSRAGDRQNLQSDSGLSTEPNVGLISGLTD